MSKFKKKKKNKDKLVAVPDYQCQTSFKMTGKKIGHTKDSRCWNFKQINLYVYTFLQFK